MTVTFIKFPWNLFPLLLLGPNKTNYKVITTISDENIRKKKTQNCCMYLRILYRTDTHKLGAISSNHVSLQTIQPYIKMLHKQYNTNTDTIFVWTDWVCTDRLMKLHFIINSWYFIDIMYVLCCTVLYKWNKRRSEKENNNNPNHFHSLFKHLHCCTHSSFIKYIM